MTEKIEKLKMKVEEAKEKVKEKAKTGVKFLAENSWIVLPALSGLGTLVLGAASMSQDRKKKYSQACLVEDDITGLNFKTKHPLTNGQIMELGERMNVGQSKGEALNEMELLKKEKKRK